MAQEIRSVGRAGPKRRGEIDCSAGMGASSVSQRDVLGSDRAILDVRWAVFRRDFGFGRRSKNP